MLCKVCHETILNSSQNWGYHRKDYQNVQKDPQVESCIFCSEVRTDALKTPHGKALQYLWTARWLPATRQDQPIMAVTFRPQIEDDLCQDSDRDEKPPPLHSGAARFPQPRVFYLFKKGKPVILAAFFTSFDTNIMRPTPRCHPNCQPSWPNTPRHSRWVSPPNPTMAAAVQQPTRPLPSCQRQKTRNVSSHPPG